MGKAGIRARRREAGQTVSWGKREAESTEAGQAGEAGSRGRSQGGSRPGRRCGGGRDQGVRAGKRVRVREKGRRGTEG